MLNDPNFCAVLLIPNDAHRHLLDEGPCGARPPMAVSLRLREGNLIDLDEPPRWLSWEAVPEHLCAGTNAEVLHGIHSPRALVLAWGDRTLEAGCLHLALACGMRPPLREWVQTVDDVLLWSHKRAILREAIRQLSVYGVVVLIDDEGLEVSHAR